MVILEKTDGEIEGMFGNPIFDFFGKLFDEAVGELSRAILEGFIGATAFEGEDLLRFEAVQILPFEVNRFEKDRKRGNVT